MSNCIKLWDHILKILSILLLFIDVTYKFVENFVRKGSSRIKNSAQGVSEEELALPTGRVLE